MWFKWFVFPPFESCFKQGYFFYSMHSQIKSNQIIFHDCFLWLINKWRCSQCRWSLLFWYNTVYVYGLWCTLYGHFPYIFARLTLFYLKNVRRWKFEHPYKINSLADFCFTFQGKGNISRKRIIRKSSPWPKIISFQ